jgi:hypothetical protein
LKDSNPATERQSRRQKIDLEIHGHYGLVLAAGAIAYEGGVDILDQVCAERITRRHHPARLRGYSPDLTFVLKRSLPRLRSSTLS